MMGVIMTVILNTWIFEKEIKRGVTQLELVDRIKKLGADGIEVRREYFKNFNEEIVQVGERAKELGLIVNYSVPDVVFTEDGKINEKLLGYFNEGEILGISKIKFNTGSFNKFNGNLKEELSKFPLNEIQMNVENDQTILSGTVEPIKTFLNAVHNAGYINVGYVYDLGNWAFTHGDAVASADALYDVTDYIHLKNTIVDGGELSTSDDLDEGIYDWRNILNHLPHDVSFALEYPMDTEKQIEQQIQLLKAEIGD